MPVDSRKLVPIALADEPGLEDVRAALRELGFAVAPPGSAQAGGVGVLISGPGFRLSRAPVAARRSRFHVVVVERMSSGVRREIDRLRPDFVLERPIDPAALRLLIQHALYAGPERRRGSRVPKGAGVRYRTGRTSRSATLIDISAGGCRIETRGSFERGQRLAVLLPEALVGAGPLALEGRVAGVSPGGAARSAPAAISIAFLPQDAPTRAALRRLVAAGVAGARALRPHAAEPVQPDRPVRDASPAAPATHSRPARRGSPRGTYRGSILATGGGGAHVLVGRDLSVGGMRVDPDPRLALGQELKLVIHGCAGRPPVVVKAVVARDEGADGCVLHFVGPSAAARARLDGIVRGLPSVCPADAARGPNVVVSEVLSLRS